MVASSLTNELIQEGRVLIRELDASATEVNAGLWFHFPDESAWKLMLALPTLERDGPKAGYAKVQKALSRLPGVSNLLLADVTILSRDAPLLGLLRTAIKKTGPSLANIRFSSGAINGVLVQDAYVYRLN